MLLSAFAGIAAIIPPSAASHVHVAQTGSGESESAHASDNNVGPYVGSCIQGKSTVSVQYSTYDVGQTITFTLSVSSDSICTSTTADVTGSLIIGSTTVKTLSETDASGSTTYSCTPSSAGSISFHTHMSFTQGSTTYSSTSGTATITVNSDPSVSISASHNPADVGQSVSFSSSISGGTSPYSYAWTIYDGDSTSDSTLTTSSSSSFSYTFSSSSSYLVSLKVTDAAGESASTSMTETVDPALSISISETHNPSDEGQSITYDTSVSGGSGTYSSYSYVLYDGTSTSDSQLASGSSSSFSYTYDSTGSYLLTYSVTDSNSNTVSTSLTQTVNTDATVSISSSQNPTDVGKTVEFTSSVSGGTQPYNLTWSINGNSYYTKDVNASFAASGSYTIELTVRDAADYSVSKTITETVNSDPTVSASSNVSSGDVNYPIEFSSTPSGGTGSYLYSWSLNGQQISTSQDFSYSFSSSGSYTLTVTITDSVGVQSSASVTVKINSNPSISVSSSQDPTDVGNSVTFSSSESGGTGADTYVWIINGVQESTASSFSYSFSSAGTYYVNVTVTDSDGHTASYSLKEKVNPDPSVSINVMHNPTDAGIWANFSASVSGGTGPFNYSWTINGQTFTTEYVNYTFTASGTFPISLTVTDANGNTASVSVNEVVNADPSVTIQASYAKVDQGINDTFAASINGGTSPFNYTWTLGGKIVDYSAEFHMNFSATGTYTLNLTVVDSLGEQAFSSITIKVIAKPSALIEGPNKTDVSTTTYWEGYGSYGTAPYNYYWFINGVNTTSGLYLEYSFPDTGEYNISLLIVDSQGAKAYAYMNVTIEPIPKVEISESLNSTDVGIPVQFTSSISGGSPFFNYSWSVSGIGIVGYQFSLTYIFSQPGYYNVSLYVSDGSGNSASSSIGIRINLLPHVRIDARYSNIDPNVTDNFNSNITGGTPGFTYTWYINGTFEGNASSITWAFTKAGIYPVRLVVKDSQEISDSYSTDVTVASYPEASIISSSTDLDANVSDQFRASGFGGIGPYGYEWIIAGHEFDNSTVSYAFKTPGNYSVQLIISDSFGKDAFSSITVDVHPDPTVSVSWSGKPVVSKPFYLNANITGGISPYQISWIFPSGQHETGSTISHVFSSSGPETFEVQVSDQGGYTQTGNFTIDVGLYVAIAANRTSGLGPLSVAFSSSVLGGSDYAFNWTFSPGHYSLEQNPVYSFPAGNYTVHFEVTSANGAKGYDNITIFSLPPPVSISYSNDRNITQHFYFNATANWDAKSQYNMTWSMPNGQNIQGMDIKYKFPVYNELNTVIATFSYDGKTYTKTFTVRMIPAIPSISLSVPKDIPSGTMLSLNATASAPDSSSFAFSWNVNGTSYSGSPILVYFDSPGNYTISLTVTDSLGATKTIDAYINVITPGTSKSITISYTKTASGPMDYYTIQVHSLHGISTVEALVGTTIEPIKLVNESYSSSGTAGTYNLTLDQRDFNAGTYDISIVAFSNNSLSNSIKIHFSVTSQYSSSTFSLGDIISFFGGISNFIIVLLTLGGLVIAYASLRRADNPDVVIDSGGVGGKRKTIVLKGKR